VGVGGLLKWQVYGTDFGPSLSTRPARNLKAGAARELRKENKNREDGCYHGDCKRGARRGQRSPRRPVKRSENEAGPCTWSGPSPLCHVGRWHHWHPQSSLWPTLCVQDCSPSPTPFFPIASSSTPSPLPLQYPPLSSMPSNLRATFTPWPSTSQRAARAFWSHILMSCLSIGILTFFLPQILANFSLLLSLMCGRLVQQLFFGTLRAVEVEVGLQVFFGTEI
jgi:hypothetical protein